MDLDQLKKQAEENPILALGVAATVVTAAAKLIDSMSAARSRRAYAKQVAHSVRKRK